MSSDFILGKSYPEFEKEFEKVENGDVQISTYKTVLESQTFFVKIITNGKIKTKILIDSDGNIPKMQSPTLITFLDGRLYAVFYVHGKVSNPIKNDGWSEKFFHKNGKIKLARHFTDGKLSDPMYTDPDDEMPAEVIFDENSDLVSQTRWRNGVRHSTNGVAVNFFDSVDENADISEFWVNGKFFEKQSDWILESILFEMDGKELEIVASDEKAEKGDVDDEKGEKGDETDEKAGDETVDDEIVPAESDDES